MGQSQKKGRSTSGGQTGSAIFFEYIHVTREIRFVGQKNMFLALESKVSIFKDCGAGRATKTS